MRSPNGGSRRGVATWSCFLAGLVVMLLSSPCLADTVSRTPEQMLRAGERMYRQGVLENGEPLRAYVKGDIPVPGTAFTCVSCHLRAGIGSVEGGVYTPPTNGRSLYQPVKKIYKGVPVKYNESPFRRPAYTDATLVEVLRSGVDPEGKVLSDVMPRYLLEDEDAELLVTYLKKLSSEFSPGVSDTEIRFATVYSEDVPAADRDAMIAGLEKYISDKNDMAKSYRRTTTARDRLMARAMSTSKELESRRLTLSRWVLKGSPDTWRAQLEEYNGKEPVFALLGGLVSGEWGPVHRFSEENRIPCLFPNTDLPVVSDTDWYTLYLSKGFYQEGEAVARFLNRRDETGAGVPVLQIVRLSREGRALADGFERTWSSLGHEPPVTVTLQEGETLTGARLAALLEREKPRVVLFWDGGALIPQLRELGSLRQQPQSVFVSGRYAGEALYALPEELRANTYIAYPYRLPGEKVIEPMMKSEVRFRVDDNRIAQQTYSLVQVLTMAVMEIKDNYFRDHFLDAIGMSMDRVVPLYERLSFGPGQRYASKGCYIVQLKKGDGRELTKMSDWVIH